jgi:GNAT superfamily N-acetyltransferase
MRQSEARVDEIREAVVSDIEALCGLLGLLLTQEAEFEPNVELQRQGLARIISDGAIGTVLVAIQDLRVIGMVNILYTVSTALGGPVALLEDLIVTPAFRGLGVGTSLLSAALDHCRSVGCRRITLLTDGDNRAAHSLYEAAGFTRSLMVAFRCPLTK